MEVEAPIWYWTPEGMRENYSSRGGKTAYLEQRVVERLLEEAHRRGFEQAKNESKNLPRF